MMDTTLTPAVLSLTMPFYPVQSSYDRRTLFPMDSSALMEDYVRALRREIEVSAPDYADCEIQALKIGGGIAGHAADEELGYLLRDLRSWFRFADDVQTVMAVHPGMISVETLTACRRGKVDWLSVDYATSDPGESEILRRFLPPSAMKTSMQVLANSPLKLSFDVLVGVPGQSESSLRRTLDDVIGFGAKRVALHMLELVPGSKLAEDVSEWKRSSSSPRKRIPDEAECAEMLRSAAEYLIKNGLIASAENCFVHVGDRFLPDACMNNHCAQIGFGLGAHTRLDGIESRTTLNMDCYLRFSTDPEKITAYANML